MDNGNEMRDFLVSRRARITAEQAGLPAYGGNRRVARTRQGNDMTTRNWLMTRTGARRRGLVITP
jgi:hypothetical protein